jgi:penicillin V acylase-like amidase (Ntn superfamily)
MKKTYQIFVLFTVSFLCLCAGIDACTVFHVSNDTVVFGGNNEDYIDYDTRIYFVSPSENGDYGRVIVGFTDPTHPIQGGMNEKGLFWDATATQYLEVKNSGNKPYFEGHILDYILETCETCDEALAILDQYNLKVFERAQILFGDRFGDSIIVEGDIIHRKSDYYQVVTNFYLSRFPNPPYPCWRYNTALDMFENNEPVNLSVEFCSSILDAVHIDILSGFSKTQYSTVYDLKNKIVYLYHNHNFNKVIIFNLLDELEYGDHSYSIPELFKQESIPPKNPCKPIGSSQIKMRRSYVYETSTIDDDGDDIFYLFDWGDGTQSEWIGPYSSGEKCSFKHTWLENGSCEIKVKAKDMYDIESNWSDALEISISRSRSIDYYPWLCRLIERFPILDFLLQESIIS